MTLNVTRGGLVPAKLVNLSTNEEVKFMFNPFEYAISKSNTWEKKPVIGKNVPQVVFQQGGAETLSLTLHFDTLADGADVRGYADTLWKMMMVDETTENPRSGKSAPPAVAFEWGRLYFKAIITSMTQKFTLFLPNGTPVRCQVDVSLEQMADDNEFQPQITGGGTGGQTAPRTSTVTQGDRMDHIAANSTGDSSNWRSVAEQNNVDNPLSLQPGQTLRTN
jgi:hypothetical protein